MVLTIIAILLFAIAIGNEGSRKVLGALVLWVIILTGLLTALAIAVGLVAGVVALATSDGPYGVVLTGLYAFAGFIVGNFYAGMRGPAEVSLWAFVIVWIFWPLALPLLIYGWLQAR